MVYESRTTYMSHKLRICDVTRLWHLWLMVLIHTRTRYGIYTHIPALYDTITTSLRCMLLFDVFVTWNYTFVTSLIVKCAFRISETATAKYFLMLLYACLTSLICMLFFDAFVISLVSAHHESRTTYMSHELRIYHDAGVYSSLMYLWCDLFVRIMSESRTTYMSHELCICDVTCLWHLWLMCVCINTYTQKIRYIHTHDMTHTHMTHSWHLWNNRSLLQKSPMKETIFCKKDVIHTHTWHNTYTHIHIWLIHVIYDIDVSFMTSMK